MKFRKIIFSAVFSLTGFTSFSQPGDYLKFDGGNDFVSVNSPQSIPIGNSHYTIEAWINPSQVGNNGVVGWGNFGVANQCNALKITNVGITNYWWGGGTNDLSVNYIFNPGTWYHVAATYDGITKKIYINGALAGSNTPGANSHNVPNANNFKVGVTNNTEYFDGGIEEVRIWDNAQSGSDIARRRFCELTGSEAGLVVYYKFNQGISGGSNFSEINVVNATSYSNTGLFGNFSLAGSTSNFLAGSPVTTGSVIPSTIPTLPATQAANLNTVSDLSPAPSSTIAWFSNATGGSALTGSEPLVCGNTYYVATINSNGCESERVAYFHSQMETPSNLVVCSGESTAVTFSNLCASNYTWTNSNTAIGLAASGTGSITSFIATNNTSSPITTTITVTPQIIVYANTTQTFNAIAAEQTWTVPAGVDTVGLVCIGASGQNSTSFVGYVSGDLPVTPGTTLYIYAGGAGSPNAAISSFNGGYYNGNASGGGASDVRVGGNTLTDRVIVAYGTGGVSSGGQWGNYAEDGQHATATAGGNGGGGTSWGQAGGLGLGGVSHITSGGGGGGYYGGGGGGDNPGPGNNGAGGNGSNYIGGVLNGITSIAGANTGGLVTISYPAASTIDGTPITFTITVNPSATISITSSDTDNSICEGASTTFTASTSNEGTTPGFRWFLNNNELVNETASTYTTNSLTNNDVVYCELTANTSCSTAVLSTEITTTVNPILAANATISSTDLDNSICEGTSVTFTVSPINGGASPSYIWYKNGTPISGETTANYTTTTLIDNDEIWSEMTSNYGCLNGSPLVATTGFIMGVNSTSSSTLEINTDAASYTWTNGVTYTNSGTYTQTLTNAAGCDSIATLVLSFDEVGIDELTSDLVQIFPNPTQNYLTVSFKEFKTASLVIYDLQGKILIDKKEMKSGEIISVEQFNKGVYMIQIQTEKGNITERLVKE